jgi:hypothetical protein
MKTIQHLQLSKSQNRIQLQGKRAGTMLTWFMPNITQGEQDGSPSYWNHLNICKIQLIHSCLLFATALRDCLIYWVPSPKRNAESDTQERTQSQPGDCRVLSWQESLAQSQRRKESPLIPRCYLGQQDGQPNPQNKDSIRDLWSVPVSLLHFSAKL